MIPISEYDPSSRISLIQCGHDPFDCQNVFVSPSVTFEASDEFEEVSTRETAEAPQSSGAVPPLVAPVEGLDFERFLFWNNATRVACNIEVLPWSIIPIRASNDEHDAKPGDRAVEHSSSFFRKSLALKSPSFKYFVMITTALL
jgi:hypothetical protein